MTLAQQFIDRVGGTPGTNVSRANFGPLVVADSFVKAGSASSTTGLSINYTALVVVINPANGSPAVELQVATGSYAVTGAATTDNYVYLSTSGAFSQTSVAHGSSQPATGTGLICLWMTIVNSGGTALSTPVAMSPTAAQLLGSSVAAVPTTVIPGFTWDATKSVNDQIVALAAYVAGLTGLLKTDGSNAPSVLPLIGLSTSGDYTTGRHQLAHGSAATFNGTNGPSFSTRSIVGNDVVGSFTAIANTTLAANTIYDMGQVVFANAYPGGSTPIIEVTNAGGGPYIPSVILGSVSNAHFEVGVYAPVSTGSGTAITINYHVIGYVP